MKRIKGALMSFVMVLFLCQNVMAAGTTWSVRYVKGAPDSSNKYSDTVVYAVQNNTSLIAESCTSANNSPDKNGFIGYVTYTGKYMDSNGVMHYNIYSQKAHYSTQGTHSIAVALIPAYSMVYGMYNLHYSMDSTAIFSGTYGS